MSVGPYPAIAQPLSPWECPRCGSVLELGSKRSLWSLLPLVCDHRAADYTAYFRERAEQDPTFDIGKEMREAGFEDREVYKRPVNGYEKGVRRWLRGRLRDELQGRRRHWWGPRLPDVREEIRDTKVELSHQRKLDGSEVALDQRPQENYAPWGPW